MAIAFVNSDYTTGVSGASSVTSHAYTATAGNALLVTVMTFKAGVGPSVSSMSDTAGNIFVSCGSGASSNRVVHVETWYSKNILGNASNQITANLASTATTIIMAVSQYSGVDTSAPLDVVTNANTTSATSLTSPSFTPTAAGELVYVACSPANATETFTAGAGFTLRNGSSATSMGVEDNVSAGAGSQTASITWGATDTGDMSVVVLKAPGASTPTVSGPPIDSGWPVSNSVTNAVASTSSTISTPITNGANRLIYVVCNWRTRSAGNANPVTVSGLGLSWTKIVTNNAGPGQVGSEIWAAWATAALGAGTITISYSSVTIDALFTAYARYATVNGAANVANCFGVSNTKSDNTGASSTRDIALFGIQANSGAVVGIVDGTGTGGLTMEANTSLDSSNNGFDSMGTGSLLPNQVFTQPPNSGTIGWAPDPTDTSWVNLLTGGFGVTGNGMTDDTAAIQAALNTGKKVYVPKPSNFYKITSRLFVGNYIVGDGTMPLIKNTVPTGQRNNSGSCLWVGTNAVPVLIQGLTLDCGWNSGATDGEWGAGVGLLGSVNVTIQYNTISNCIGDNVMIGDGALCKNIKVYKNTLNNPYRCCCSAEWSDGVVFDSNTCSKTTNYVTAFDAEPNPDGQEYDNNLQITNNVWSVPNAVGIMLYHVNFSYPPNGVAGTNITVTGNSGSTGTWNKFTQVGNWVNVTVGAAGW